ncbi:transposable element Tc1 transposase [Trichonephila clavipes]|nr:transposable element Tc1 transposase [Trichonephila clavipes]
MSSDCRRQLIWRKSGTAYRPEIIQEKDRYPTYGIMVWAGIMINGRTRLHVVANGTMTGQRYIDEVLLPHVHLNPIENVWDALRRQVAGRNYPQTNKNTLIRALTEEWDKLPEQLLDNVVQSANVHEQMTRSGGQFEANPLCLDPQASFVLIYLLTAIGTTLPSLDIEPGPVVWKHDTLTLDHWA